MRKFEFKKSYEEIEIAGDIYRLDMSDEKIKEYQKEFFSFYEKSKKIEKQDLSKLDEHEQFYKEVRAIVESLLNTLLGENSFSKLYEKSGKSLFNLIELVVYLADIVEEKSEHIRKKKREYYTKKNKRG